MGEQVLAGLNQKGGGRFVPSNSPLILSFKLMERISHKNSRIDPLPHAQT